LLATTNLINVQFCKQNVVCCSHLTLFSHVATAGCISWFAP
jgi:hypothetical protein